jgi:hypothetical protein
VVDAAHRYGEPSRDATARRVSWVCGGAKLFVGIHFYIPIRLGQLLLSNAGVEGIMIRGCAVRPVYSYSRLSKFSFIMWSRYECE